MGFSLSFLLRSSFPFSLHSDSGNVLLEGEILINGKMEGKSGKMHGTAGFNLHFGTSRLGANTLSIAKSLRGIIYLSAWLHSSIRDRLHWDSLFREDKPSGKEGRQFECYIISM